MILLGAVLAIIGHFARIPILFWIGVAVLLFGLLALASGNVVY
jgi:hypothetical protein